MKVLVVEDDPGVSQFVSTRLKREGMDAIVVTDGARAVHAVRQHRPDLILLDLNLPGRDGRDICRELRLDPTFARIPVIIMSGLGGDVDRIVGLEIGADDYVTKPFNDRELALRIRAVLRRTQGTGGPPVRRFGSLEVDLAQRRVTLNGTLLALTTKEFDLLMALVEARGRVLARKHLLREVWGYERGEDLYTRTVDVHVRHLRQKLGAEAHRIETIKGVGYRLNPDVDAVERR
jgi:two-component system alkaline phosphatase synthesis response regulator PhoP